MRAALAIQRALVEINARNARSARPQLSARIGFECGSVVVDATGEVFGDAPNLAARVQAEAEAGSVLITLNVQRQVAGPFVAEEQSARELKGVSRACPALSHRSRQRRRPKGWHEDANAVRRPRGGTGPASAPLAARLRGRRPACADRRRAWPRQVTSHRGVPLTARRNAAHLGRMERLATVAEHAAASDRRMGAAAIWCGRCRPSNASPTSKAPCV